MARGYSKPKPPVRSPKGTSGAALDFTKAMPGLSKFMKGKAKKKK